MPKTPATEIKQGMTFVFLDELRVATADATPATMNRTVRLTFRTDSIRAVTTLVVPEEWSFFAHSRPVHRVAVSQTAGWSPWRHACQDCNIHATGYVYANTAVEASRTLHAMTNDTIVPQLIDGPAFEVTS